MFKWCAIICLYLIMSDSDYNSPINNCLYSENIFTSNNKIIKRLNKKPIENLILSGGSVKGISHIGAINRLIDLNILDLNSLKSVTGVSVGSIIGCLITLGFTPDEIRDFIFEIDLNKLVKPDLILFIQQCGIDNGNKIQNLIEKIIKSKTGTDNISFDKLYQLTGIDFTVVASCLTTKKPVYYNYLSTPKFSVSLAIRISISMPGFFTPVIIEGLNYVDGGILDNYPMHLFKDKLDKTIGILITNEYNTTYNYPEEYFMTIVNLFMHYFYNSSTTQYIENTIFIDQSLKSISIFNFNVDHKSKIKLYNFGIYAVDRFFSKLQWSYTEDF